MPIFLRVFWGFLFTCFGVWAVLPTQVFAGQGCRAVQVNCECTRPDKKFTLPHQKVGKVNPGDVGDCRSKTYIDEFLKNYPLVPCLQEGGVRDPRQGQSHCEATWSCEEPCDNPI